MLAQLVGVEGYVESAATGLLGTVLGVISAGKDALAFVSTWELSLLGAIVYGAAAAWMNIRSFRTLTDPSVKAYFG